MYKVKLNLKNGREIVTTTEHSPMDEAINEVYKLLENESLFVIKESSSNSILIRGSEVATVDIEKV
ncbi:MAG: hypothetical protein RR782_02590 [Clostridium sp.]